MKSSFRLILVVGILALSSLACSLTSGGDAPSGDSNVLFQDDFSDSGSGWQILREGEDIIDYESGGFRFYVPESSMDYWSVANLNLTDVHIEVDATKTGGPDDNDFGIICRYQDSDNFYGFLISSDGYYGISKMKDGEHNILSSESMEYSDKVQTGTVTNRIGADCVGSKLVLYVNDELLVQYEDAEFTSGDIGLMAGTFDTPGVDILFDNLVVTKP